MATSSHRLLELCDTLEAFVVSESRSAAAVLTVLIDQLTAWSTDSADPRLRRLRGQLARLEERCTLSSDMITTDHLARIRSEVATLAEELADERFVEVVAALSETPSSPEPAPFGELLLDRLIAATGAQRGFLLLCEPESTAAQVLAARDFRTRVLAAGEYDFSRTVLRELMAGGAAVRVADASDAYARVRSVYELRLRSILAVPLHDGERLVGALYLENNTLPGAFDRDDQTLAERVGRFAVAHLRVAGQLPAVIERRDRYYLDPQRAGVAMIGLAPRTRELFETVEQLADTPATVLLVGETGTGKELVARALHHLSGRRDGPFVAINCAALPESLLETELFGHEKGAFTDAREPRQGKFEHAHGGTLFLDEVHELAMPLQAKLLRCLETREIDRVGGKAPIPVDVRLVSASSRDLGQMVAAGNFQETLYYRLNVVPLELPPLRERREDIPDLVDHFVTRFAASYRKDVRILPEVHAWLRRYDFPGNIRELRNLVERLVALARGEVIRLDDLRRIGSSPPSRSLVPDDDLDAVLETPLTSFDELAERRREVERRLELQTREMVERAVAGASGNVSEAARRLGVHRSTLHKYMRHDT